MHEAAARADGGAYFDHFADDAVFLGTDATERWDMRTFHAYADPRFVAGKGWTLRAVRRSVTVSDDGTFAYFDEDLDGTRLGAARGSGVLALQSGRWKVEVYNLALTIPNDRFAEVRALVDAPAPPPFEQRRSTAYAEATADAARGDFVGADRRLDLLVEEAGRRDGDAEFWLHNEKTWLRWAAGDLAGALDEVNRAKGALARAKLSPAASARTGLHEKWDRAYLLLELAQSAAPGLRVEANKAADVARADYEAAAAPLNDHDGQAVLSAFFAVRRHQTKEAVKAADSVDPAADGDVQDLYVLSLAYAAAGQHDKAEAVVRRIRDAKEYLMKPLILHQLKVDRASFKK